MVAHRNENGAEIFGFFGGKMKMNRENGSEKEILQNGTDFLCVRK